MRVELSPNLTYVPCVVFTIYCSLHTAWDFSEPYGLSTLTVLCTFQLQWAWRDLFYCILNVNPTILSVNLMYVLRFTALNALMKINVISFALTIFNDHGQIIRWFPKKLCQWFLVGRLAHVVGRLAHVSGQISSWSGQISSCQWAD